MPALDQRLIPTQRLVPSRRQAVIRQETSPRLTAEHARELILAWVALGDRRHPPAAAAPAAAVVDPDEDTVRMAEGVAIRPAPVRI